MLRPLLLPACVALVFSIGCGAGDVSPPPAINGLDGGGSDGQTILDGGGGDSPAAGTVQSGQIVTLQLNTPVVGATLSGGLTGGTTDSKGMYQFTVDPAKSFHMTVAAPNYYTLFEQETLVTSTIDLGKTSLLAENTAKLLLLTLTGYMDTLGVLSVSIEKQSTCPDEGGAVLAYTVDGKAPVAPANLLYAQGGVPVEGLTSAQSGEFPHAVIYNLPPQTPIVITVTHPTCTMVPFPVSKDLTVTGGTGTVQYVNSSITTLAGKNTSFVRVFLK